RYLMAAWRKPAPPPRGAARRERARTRRRGPRQPRGRRAAAPAAALHGHARAAQPGAAGAVPGGAQYARDGRDPRPRRKQCHHTDQPPQAAVARLGRRRRLELTAHGADGDDHGTRRTQAGLADPGPHARTPAAPAVAAAARTSAGPRPRPAAAAAVGPGAATA